MMVTTVTLNPALDYHITLPGLAPGEIQWFSHSSFSPGGKGINVSLLLSSLGVETRALGIAAGFTGREIARLLEERGCPADMVFLEEGCSRVNVKLQTPGGEETAFNGPGPDIPPQAVAQLLGKLSTLGPEDVLVLSGSLPQGLPETAFPQLLEAARRAGAKLVVDMAGDPLLASLPYHPFLIKPNLEELCQLFQAEGPSPPWRPRSTPRSFSAWAPGAWWSLWGRRAPCCWRKAAAAWAAAAPGGRLSPPWARGTLWWPGSSMGASSTAPWRAA